MRTFLEKAHDISSIGTFILTIVVVLIMVVPMLRPPQQIPQNQTPQNSATGAGKPMIGWLMPSILVVCILLTGVLNFLAARERRRPTATMPTPEALRTQTRLASRVPTNATLSQLTEIWKHNTAVQAKKLSEVYIGTWITVSGSVYDVKQYRNEFHVQVAGSGVSIVSCAFALEWDQRCSGLRKGDSISVLGKVSDFDQALIWLGECEFI
jgi:putative nucleic acid binding protein